MNITIKEVRQRLNLTQSKMAELLGMSQPALAKIETGVEARKETKGHIAHLIALGIISENDLLGDLQNNILKNKTIDEGE
ncbi:MAG: helix-turn-helix transcriptional regulator [Desulfobulbaceae bacterium]|nr:helix-turn-helix transcriptional regulator [Desulfobulbaceae bacterium]